MSSPVSDLKVQLDLESAVFRAELAKTTKSIDDVSSKLTRIADKLGGSAKEVFKGVAAWDMLSGAVQRAGQILTAGVQGFAAEEQASLRLSSALTQLGYNADALLGPLEAQQRAMERSTLAGGDQILQMQQLMLQWGVAPKDIERTTKSILDYSAATGKDALSSTEALLKSVRDGKDGVASLGLTYASAGDSAKDLGLAVGQLEDKFGGSAQAAAAGMAGTLDQLQKSQDNLAKSFGGFVAQIEQRVGVIRSLTTVLDDVRIAMGGANPDEAQFERQKRIGELAAEKHRLDRAGQLTTVGGKRLEEIVTEIRQLQKESAEYLKRPGVVHSDQLGGGTEITEGVSKQARDANKPKAENSSKSPSRTLADVLDDLNDRLRRDGAKIAESLRTPFEVFSDEIEKLDQLLRHGAISLDNYDRAVAKVNDELDKSLIDGVLGGANRATESVDELGGALDRLAQKGIGMTGRLGQVFNAGTGETAQDAAAGIQGLAGPGMSAAMAGGLGAIVAVLAEVLTDSEAFLRLVELSAEVVKAFADALGPIIDPVVRLVAALVPFGAALGELLAPLGILVDSVLRPIGPLFVVLGAVLGSLTPIMQMLVGALAPLVDIALVLVHGAVYGLFHALKYLGLGFLEFAGWVAPFWNGIIETIAKVFGAIADFEIAGAHPFGFLDDWANSISRAVLDTDEISRQKQKLNALTWSSAQAKIDEIAATEEMTEAANYAASALFNLPAGYKVKAAQYDAANALDGMQVHAFAAGGVVSKATLAVVGEGGETEVIAPESMLRKVFREEGASGRTVNVTIVSNDPQVLWRKLKRVMEAENFNMTGDIIRAGG